MSITAASAGDEQPDDHTAFEKAYDETVSAIGRVNIAVVGESGAGKSSLINAVFGADVAATGMGDAVTKGVNYYQNSTGTLGVHDFEGFEIKAARDPLRWLRKEVKSRRSHKSPDPIHVAWYCVNAHSHRFTDGQRQLVEALASMDIPVLLVLTKADMVNGVVDPKVEEFRATLVDKGLPLFDRSVFVTSTRHDVRMGARQHGLSELLGATFRAAPDEVHLALNAAQKIDLARKATVARRWIAVAAAASGAAGANPISVGIADAALIVPTQLALMGKIATLYGIPKKEALAVAGVTTTIATNTGKTAVVSLAKLIPVAGSAVAGGVAAVLTAAIGEGWRVVCEKIMAGELQLNDLQGGTELAQAFQDAFRKSVRSVTHPKAA